MITIKKSFFSIILIFISNFGIGQNIVIKYVGISDEYIHLYYDSMYDEENLNVLTTNSRVLSIKNNSATKIHCCDITRMTNIFAATNEVIEFEFDKSGLITYYCKTNPYRKLESNFIIDCFVKYGETLNEFDFKMNKIIFTAKYKTRIFDANYTKEQELLEEYYLNDKISKEFYNHFKTMYWSLTKCNELENNNKDESTF